MASSKWYVLTEERFMKNEYVCNSLQEKCELVSLEMFVQNPAQYEDRINGFYGGLWCLSNYHLKQEDCLNKMPNVKVAVIHGAGTDHINLPMLWEKGIRVATTGNVNAGAAAELGFALMMASARKIKLAMTALMTKIDFKTFDEWRDINCGTSLEGSTLGVVGMGSIGYKVAERAAAFEMNILYHNRSQRSKEDEERVKATYCETLDKLLVQSDFVMLCVPLTKDTECLIGAKELKLMKPTAVVINICRGDVIDQDALVKALQDNSIKGAALDVTTPEPLPPDHPLLHMPNVIVTPHYAGSTQQVLKEIFRITIDNLLAGLEDRIMTHELKAPQQ